MDIKKIIKEFSQADMDAYIQANPAADLKYKEVFPLKYTTEMTLEALSQNTGLSVAASVVAFDSQAPRFGRPGVDKYLKDLPKIEGARVKNETALNTYFRLLDRISRSNNPQVLKQLIDFMYEDTKFAADAVNARMELLAKNIASTGETRLTVVNNANGVASNVDIDFGIPAANKVNATVDYSLGTAHNPLEDLKGIRAKARAKGVTLRYATTDSITFENLVKSESFQKNTAGYVATSLGLTSTPTLEQANTMLRAQGLPEFRIWDSMVSLEQKDGTHVAESGWQEGNITFTESPTFGDSQWTDVAESFINFDDSVKSQNDFLLVKVFAEQDPITIITKGVAYATPVLQGANSVFILKTKLG